MQDRKSCQDLIEIFLRWQRLDGRGLSVDTSADYVFDRWGWGERLSVE